MIATFGRSTLSLYVSEFSFFSLNNSYLLWRKVLFSCMRCVSAKMILCASILVKTSPSFALSTPLSFEVSRDAFVLLLVRFFSLSSTLDLLIIGNRSASFCFKSI